MLFIREWFETNVKEKDAEWADRVVRHIRIYMRQLVSESEAAEGMAYLLGYQDMSFIKALFQNTTRMNLANQSRRSRLVDRFNNNIGSNIGSPVIPHAGHDEFLYREMSDVKFRPIQLLEKHLRINIAEMRKMGPVVNVRASDPLSTEGRERDRALLENKGDIEKDLTNIYTKIGKPPVKLNQLKSRFGEHPGNGNTNDFENMGMDSEDPADVSMFMKYFHKLFQEMAAQGLIDYTMTDNEIMDKIGMWVTDLWAKKACGWQCYVSEVTGKIMHTYIAPENIWIYGSGRRKDYNDANAKCVQQKLTVKEMLDRIGNSFDFEAEWDKLLMAISFTGNNVEYTDIHPSYREFCAGGTNGEGGGALFNGDRNYTMEDFMALKVTLGYVEWSSQNQETFGIVKSEHTFYQDNQPPNGERYQTKARFETPTYKCWFLAVSMVEAVLFNYGLQTFQQIEGYDDFNTNFTIGCYKEIGVPLAIQAKEFIDIFHESFWKLRYELRRAKPRGTDINYDSMITMAEDLITDSNFTKAQKLEKMVEMWDATANTFWTFPRNPDTGQILQLTNNQLNIDKPNGLTPEVMKYWEICTSMIEAMKEFMTGSTPLGEGNAPPERSSMNNEFKALQSSQDSIGYVPDILTFLFQNLSTKAILFAQDIVQFKDENTLAYQYLLSAVGEETLEKINGLGKKALHRYGIFVESLNQTVQRAKLSARIDAALLNKQIDDGDALLIEDIKNPKEAYAMLAWLKRRKAKADQKAQMELQQQAQQAQQALEQERQNAIKIKGGFDLQVASMNNQTLLQQHANTNNTQITKQMMKDIADLKKVFHQADANIMEESAIANQNKIPPQTAPMPAPPQAPQGPGGPPLPQQRQPTAIGEQIAQTQPGGGLPPAQ